MRIIRQLQFAIIAVLALIPLTAFLSARGDEPPSPSAVMARWAAKTKEVRSVTASFIQTRRMKIFTEPIVSKGKLLMRIEPGRTSILWHTIEPEEGYTSITPERILTWLPAEKSAEEIPFGKAQEPFARLLLGPVLPAGIEADFEITESADPAPAHGEASQVLIPRSEAVRRIVAGIRIVVDEESGLVKRLAISEPSGDRIEVALADFSVNPPLDPAALDVPIPADVKVAHPLGDTPSKD
ncbi:MAG: outer membrane lipoprotein carrier protein LolA [Planctomycetes bacterium]|nr:outer membrane lipoprotein carrier protein LolA [Planctomycetota bacterium]